MVTSPQPVPQLAGAVLAVTEPATDEASALAAAAELSRTLAANPEPTRLVCVTCEGFAVLAGDPVNPARASLAPLMIVIGQERPSVDARVLQCEAAAGWTAVADAVADESACDRDMPMVVHRGGRAWTLGTEPEVTPAGTAHARAEGIYLVVGAGHVGSTLAQHLAVEIGACVVLADVAPAPAALEVIAAAGGKVAYEAVDVAARGALKRCIRDILATYGTLTGVVYAPGLRAAEGIGPLDAFTAELVGRHLETKGDGLVLLEDALEALELDWVVVASSLSSVLGGVGTAAYAAACAHADSFVRAHNTRSGQHWLSVLWDHWLSERELGGRPMFGHGLAPEEAVTSFTAVAGATSDTVVVASGSLERRRARRAASWQAREVEVDAETTAAEAASDGPSRERPAGQYLRPELDVAYVEPQNEIEKYIAGLWANMLGLDRVGANDSFFELGGDSLSAMQITARLRDEFKVDLPLEELFEQATVAAIAQSVSRGQRSSGGGADELDRMLSEIEQLSDDEVESRLKEIGS